MKFFSFVVSAVLASLAAAETLQYDPAYDDGDASLTTVSCSDGANGLITKGFSTFKSLPSFPNIGAFAAVSGWNSTNCGTCWNVTYTNATGESTSLNVLAVDHAGDDFINVSEEAMNTLTDDNAVAFGAVPVTSVQVDASACGL